MAKKSKLSDKYSLQSLAAVVVIMSAVVVGGLAYARSMTKLSPTKSHQSSYQSPIRNVLYTPSPLPPNRPTPTISPDKYGFRSTKTQMPISYRNVGQINQGELNGYNLVMVKIEPDYPSLLSDYLLATKDYKKFFINGDDEEYKLTPEDDVESLAYTFDKSKIEGVRDLLSLKFPEEISLNETYELYRGGPWYDYDSKGKKFVWGGKSVNFTPLPSPDPTLQLYAIALSTYRELEKYAGDTTGVIAVNNDGLAVRYELASKTDVKRYKEELPKYRTAYLQALKDGNWFKAPNFISTPGLRKLGTEISTSMNLYTHYDVAIPGGCGGGVSTIVAKSMSEKDLVSMGWTNGVEYFKLADPNHPLLKLQYDSKYGLGEYEKPPSLAKYVEKVPLVFFKDNWGRWIMLGEYDVALPGGCGKPVVYLYPTKPTEVSVAFETLMRLDVQIPSYNNGWKVLANPDGILKDLQPEMTDCNKFDGITFGQEYALNACKTATYPYIYWAGRSPNDYQTPQKGWIVEREQVEKFLKQKLTYIGLNEKEIKDMTDYWVPELLQKKAKYYRLAFLQNLELNTLAPMTVSPAPDSVIRVFLDWDGYENKPSFDIEPQNLRKYERNGFTLVEWGGLKK